MTHIPPVLQQLARFILIQYRNDLLSLEAKEQGLSDRSLEANTCHVAADRENLFYDLLTVLHT